MHLRIYGQNGKPIISNDTIKCLSYIQNYASKHNDKAAVSQIFNPDLEEFNYNLITLDTGDSLNPKNALQKPVNIFVYYGNFMGKYHFQHLREMQKIAKKENQNIILINCDFRQEWKDSLKLNLKSAKTP
ncbi:MAG: hypothetical protein SFU27_02550 [Thermonemataceae bacterium]|nr:hypothetical protein [Thermonemataceae bacterium]